MDIGVRIAELLAEQGAESAREFFRIFEEARTGSWADAHHQAKARAASEGHLPQLRHHLGEQALVASAQQTGHGALAMETVMPGARFMLARVGRFGLVSLKAASRTHLPRRSETRCILSQSNEPLEPQKSLFDSDPTVSYRRTTELAYFACLLTIPCVSDPTVPAEFVFAVPRPDMTGWINTISIARLHALLLDVETAGRTDDIASPAQIVDRAFPQIRLPDDVSKSDE